MTWVMLLLQLNLNKKVGTIFQILCEFWRHNKVKHVSKAQTGSITVPKKKKLFSAINRRECDSFPYVDSYMDMYVCL